MRRALSRAPLIEQHDAIGIRIVKLPILWHQSATRPTMQKHHRLPIRIAALLVIKLVNVRHFQTASVVGFDCGIEGTHLSHLFLFYFGEVLSGLYVTVKLNWLGPRRSAMLLPNWTAKP